MDIRSIPRLCAGAGSPEVAACWMSAIRYLEGSDAWDDRPESVDPLLHKVCVWINDRCTSDAMREKLIGPNIFPPMGTQQGLEVSIDRFRYLVDFVIEDWLIPWARKQERLEDAIVLRKLIGKPMIHIRVQVEKMAAALGGNDQSNPYSFLHRGLEQYCQALSGYRKNMEEAAQAILGSATSNIIVGCVLSMEPPTQRQMEVPVPQSFGIELTHKALFSQNYMQMVYQTQWVGRNWRDPNEQQLRMALHAVLKLCDFAKERRSNVEPKRTLEELCASQSPMLTPLYGSLKGVSF